MASGVIEATPIKTQVLVKFNDTYCLQKRIEKFPLEKLLNVDFFPKGGGEGEVHNSVTKQ